jgi:hypothetical protein
MVTCTRYNFLWLKLVRKDIWMYMFFRDYPSLHSDINKRYTTWYCCSTIHNHSSMLMVVDDNSLTKSVITIEVSTVIYIWIQVFSKSVMFKKFNKHLNAWTTKFLLDSDKSGYCIISTIKQVYNMSTLCLPNLFSSDNSHAYNLTLTLCNKSFDFCSIL